MTDLLNSPISIKDMQNKFATSGIYAIYCKKSDTYYIGQATVVLRRLVDHFVQLSKDEHQNDSLQFDYNEYGENYFIVDLLIDLPDSLPKDLLNAEKKEIQRFKLHGKKLYNKTGLSISGFKKEYQQTINKNANSHNRNPKKSYGRKLSNAEQHKDKEEFSFDICYECGLSGVFNMDIFECDDKKNRCAKCVESYLEKKFTFVTKRNILAKRTKRNRCFRRQYLVGRSYLKEHLILALEYYSQRFGGLPRFMYISNDEIVKFDMVKGVEVKKRKVTPRGYIDLPL